MMRSRESSLLLCVLVGAVIVAVCDARSHYIKNVPYHRQVTDYACGDASLQMVLEYSGPKVDQKAVIDAARASEAEGTETFDIVRVGHFSQLSSAVGVNFPENSPKAGFVGRPLGNAAFEHLSDHFWLEELKNVIDQDIPVIVLMHYALNDTGGHFRVVVGYDDSNSTIYTNDPWNRPPDTREIVGFSYKDFQTLWNYTEVGRAHPFFGAMIMPWHVAIKSIPSPTHNNIVDVAAAVTYTCVHPFPCHTSTSKATNTLVSVQLSAGLSLGASERSSVWLGELKAGETRSVSWNVTATDSAALKSGAVQVKAQGYVHGSVYNCYCDSCYGNYYPGYDYVDVIGGEASASLF